MSYDLYFKSRNPASVPEVRTFAKYFAERANYETSDKQAIYQNEDTGVYFIFDLGDADIEDQSGLVPLSFNLNYFRPHIFGLEAEPELKALVEHFDLLVFDPQTEGVGDEEFLSQGFRIGWNHGNEFAYRSIIGQGPDEKRLTLPTAKIEACWKWNLNRAALQEELGDDVFVPKFAFINQGGDVATAIVWPDGIPSAVPEADVLLIPRKTILPKRFFRTPPEDIVLANWTEVSTVLEQFPLEQHSLPCRVMRYSDPPDSVLSLVRRLRPGMEKPQGVSVDTILNAEMVDRAKSK